VDLDASDRGLDSIGGVVVDAVTAFGEQVDRLKGFSLKVGGQNASAFSLKAFSLNPCVVSLTDVTDE
jgi:hypothetical protein